MAQQTINVGASPNDGTGTPLRTAFQYTNSNFSELYTAVGPSGNNIVCPGSATITGDLTVDTSTLKVDSANDRVGIGTASPAQKLTVAGSAEITGGVVGQGALIGRDGGSGGATYGSNAGNTNLNAPAGGGLRFNVNNGVFAGMFDTSGNMGILNSSPFSGTSNGLTIGTVGTGSAKQIALQMANCYARMRERNVVNDFSITTNINVDNVLDDNTRPSWMMRLGAGSDLFSVFRAAAGSTSFTTLATVNPSGDINLIGNLVPTNGKGIDFSATPSGSGTMTSELLSDYEEGTFTPIVLGTTSAGTGTYSGQVGRYTKVGNLVTVHVYLAWTAHTGTGNMRLGGLPFASSSDANSNCSVTFGYVQNMALTAGNILTGFTSVSNTFIDCYQTPSGGGASTSVPIDTDAIILYSVSYRV